MLKPIILAGGKGSRLWPLSRKSRPKAFLTIPFLSPNSSLIQNTLNRIASLNNGSCLIICNKEHLRLAMEHVYQIEVSADFLLEPIGKNTAPAIAISALYSLKNGDDPTLIILPADHVIQDIEGFHLALNKAFCLSEQNYLVTLGCLATYASTEYGYIKFGKNENNESFPVEAFIEKPNKKLAKEYLHSEEYLWNSGVYIVKASNLITEFKRFQPKLLEACRAAISKGEKVGNCLELDKASLLKCPSISFDHAIVEPMSNSSYLQRVRVIPISVGWSDIGTWRSLIKAMLNKLKND